MFLISGRLRLKAGRRLVTMERSRIAIICTIGVLAGVSFVLALFRIPFPILTSHKYDLADVPALIGSFTMGPLAGLTIVVVRNVLYMIKDPHPVHFIMNLAASGNLVFWAGFIYVHWHSKRGALQGLAVGVVATTCLMVPLNLLVVPHYMGVPSEKVWTMLLPVIIPFNLTKHTLTALATFLLYKQVSRHLPHYRYSQSPLEAPKQ